MTEYSAPTSQRVIRAKVEIKWTELIHNDLANSAYYFRERIAERLKAGDKAGIFAEMLATLTMSAFALEAYVNFIASMVPVHKWNDRDGIADKVKRVRNQLGVTSDYNKRPYRTIERLVDLRNQLAHGKPKVTEIEEEQQGTSDEIMKRVRSFQPEIELLVTPEFTFDAYDDVEAIWQELLTASGISLADTMSGGSSGAEFIEHL